MFPVVLHHGFIMGTCTVAIQSVTSREVMGVMTLAHHEMMAFIYLFKQVSDTCVNLFSVDEVVLYRFDTRNKIVLAFCSIAKLISNVVYQFTMLAIVTIPPSNEPLYITYPNNGKCLPKEHLE